MGNGGCNFRPWHIGGGNTVGSHHVSWCRGGAVPAPTGASNPHSNGACPLIQVPLVHPSYFSMFGIQMRPRIWRGSAGNAKGECRWTSPGSWGHRGSQGWHVPKWRWRSRKRHSGETNVVMAVAGASNQNTQHPKHGMSIGTLGILGFHGISCKAVL